MSTNNSRVALRTLAAAHIDSDAAAPVYRWQRGFAGGTAIVRNGAGDYTLTLDDDTADIDDNDLLITAGLESSGLGTISVERASSTTLRIRTATVTATPTVAAADLDYWIKVEIFGPQ